MKLEARCKISPARELVKNQFWQQVEKLPVKENYRDVMNVMELPMQLLAAPELRPELLGLRGKEQDLKTEFKLVEDYLKKKIVLASNTLFFPPCITLARDGLNLLRPSLRNSDQVIILVKYNIHSCIGVPKNGE